MKMDSKLQLTGLLLKEIDNFESAGQTQVSPCVPLLSVSVLLQEMLKTDWIRQLETRFSLNLFALHHNLACRSSEEYWYNLHQLSFYYHGCVRMHLFRWG